MFKDTNVRYTTKDKPNQQLAIDILFSENYYKEKETIMAAYRQGRGARSERVADGTEINENTSVSMGDDDNEINNDIPLPELPNNDEDILKKLIH